ncbi:uncharacterized protein LOC139915705 [Centroberyx gerrardi]
MSRPRSRSPHYRMSPRRHEGAGGHSRRFPWDEPDFDPQKVLAELDGMPMDRSRRPREDLEESWAFFMEDNHSEGQRRSPPFPDDHQFGHQHHPDLEEFYRRTPPPHPHELGYAERRRLSPKQVHHRREGGDRGRGGFREHFENRGRPLHSPQRPNRERFPSTPPSHFNHQQREPATGWRREERGRSQGSRDLDDRGGGEGRERGRRDAQGLNRERRRDDLHQERTPPLKRHRRDMDDPVHLGYGKGEEFREQRFSLERPRDGFEGGTQGGFSRGEVRHSGPLVVEHDHGIAKGRGPPRWEQFDSREDRNPDFDRESRPRQAGSQERFRKSNSRSDVREETRGRHIQDGRRDIGCETRRSPMLQDRASPMGFADRAGPMNHRGRSGPRPARGRANRGRGGRTETAPHRNHPRLQQFPQRRQDLPQEHQRQGYRPAEEDRYADPLEEESSWGEEASLRQWDRDRPGGLDQHLPRNDLDPKMPRQREGSWTVQQETNEMTVVSEETLTIKVDMSRPANQNSLLCYSSDRQLSLDLVNVGRQRLDFLPMLEHSGTYRESAMHTGTFAQEIITLVHQVKEHYFRGDSITLNERFSAPQEGGFPEEEVEELVEEEMATFNRGFSTNFNMLPDDEPLFTRAGPMQPLRQQLLRDPGDLRHDLERRRQERLEGVKVTIPGGSLAQRPLGPVSEQSVEYGDEDEMVQVEEGGFSSWTEEQGRRWGGNMGPRRGAPYRQSAGPQRRNNRLGNRLGPMRRQNNRNNDAGANW